MSIPWVVLSSQDYLSQETISNHFDFCDALYNASHVYSQKKKNKSNKTKSFNNIQNQLSFKPQKPYNYSSLQEQVFNWFFSLDITTRITVSSIHNKWLVNLLSQLWKLQYYEHKVRFKPNIHMEEFFDEDKPVVLSLNQSEKTDFNFYRKYFEHYCPQFYDSECNQTN